MKLPINKPILTTEQVSHLSRDYSLYPIKKAEPILESDLRYLYLELNFTIREIQLYLGRNGCPVSKYLKQYNIIKSKEQIKETSKRTSIQHWGTSHPNQSKQMKQILHEINVKNGRGLTPKQTYFEKYDTEEPLTRQEKIKITNLKRYGREFYFQTENFKEKAKKTWMKNYGVDNSMKALVIQDRAKQTNIERYGYDNAAKSPEIKEKILQSNLEHWGSKTYCESKFYNKDLEMEKRRQTNIQKFGVQHPLQLDEFKEKQKENVLAKYGVENVCQIPEIRNKIHETTKKNNSFGKSRGENFVFETLLRKFPNTQRQYKTIEYPFACDFYIPELDLYIEYQEYQGHGGHPFNPTDETDRKKLKEWKEKAIKNPNGQYKTYIKIWTISDPRKRQIVKDNNLNWIEFFNREEFLTWYNSLEEI